MNELTKNIQKMMVPKAAIIAYKYEDRRNFDTRYFIELRPIGKNGQMGAGIPVTYEFMNTLLEYWEKRFWLTEFSHLGGNVNPTVSNLVIVTENIRNDPFDMNELKPMNKKLKDILP